MNLLPLDTWRAILGLNPWHFWGLADTRIVPIVSKCSTLVFEYDWQGSDAAGRSTIRTAIERAEQKLRTYLGYWPAPKYVETDALIWPRFNDAAQVRYLDRDSTGRRVAMVAPDGLIQAMGIEQLTAIGTATVGGGTLVYSDEFSTGFDDTFTITLPTTVTDPEEIAVYFSVADRFDNTAVGARWRIEPLQISISGGNVTIIGRRWLVVRPILYQRPSLQALDPTVAGNFVTSLDVYHRTTNQNGNSVTTAQATLIYETTDCGNCWGSCCCYGGIASSDPGTVGEVIARAGIRDSRLGLVTPGAAIYDPTAGTWSSAWCCSGGYCDPDRVRLRYLAGVPLENGAMADRWQGIVTKLAAAELKRRICACRETNEQLHDLQMDMALESTQTERYRRTDADMNNPFGTRLGHIQAWKESKDHILRRGQLA